jgi:hypothetical protein
MSQLFLLAWNTNDAIAWGNKAIALAEHLGETETLVHALHNVGMARNATGGGKGRQLVERSLHLALAANLEEHAARAYGNLGLSLVVDYRFAEAVRVLAAGIAYCAERDLDQQRFYMLAWRALSQFQQGHWSDAAEIAADVIRQRYISPTSRIMALVALGRVQVRRGDPAAGAVLDEALALATQTGGPRGGRLAGRRQRRNRRRSAGNTRPCPAARASVADRRARVLALAGGSAAPTAAGNAGAICLADHRGVAGSGCMLAGIGVSL